MTSTEGKKPSQIPYSHEKIPEHAAQLKAEQEIKKQLTPEESFRAIKERQLFYTNLQMSLGKEIEKNNPESTVLSEARTQIINRAIGLSEALSILSGQEFPLPETKYQSFKWLGNVMQRYSQGKPEQK